MNISEANDVVTILRVLDGTAWDRHDNTEILAAAQRLAERVGKPLQLTVDIDLHAIDAAVGALEHFAPFEFEDMRCPACEEFDCEEATAWWRGQVRHVQDAVVVGGRL